ncbi:MAG: cytochrome c [Gemmatimonadetes bacterium]|nr:cytochrome c [Gemmatimonadota bacterium]
MSDDTLAQILVKGGKGMPAFEKLLKPDEVLELVNYIRTLQP